MSDRTALPIDTPASGGYSAPMSTRCGRRLAPAALLLALACGCLGRETLPPPVPVAAPGPRPNVLRTAIADRPAGDAYLGEGVWAAATRPLPHELATLLARNGLRVGVLSGVPPSEFVALMGHAQGLIDPADRAFTPGRADIIPVAGPLPQCQFALTAAVAADPVPHTFDAAECGLAVTLTELDAGRIELACEPRFQFGQPRAFILPAADATFTRRERKMREPLTHLAFRAKLDPGESLIIGPTDNPAGTLGGAFFLDTDPGRARQRLLIVQVKP